MLDLIEQKSPRGLAAQLFIPDLYGLGFFLFIFATLNTMMMKNNVYRQQLPLWTSRLISPVHVSDIGSTYSFDGKALWDTGAEVSVISRCVAEACRLKDFLLKGSVRDMTEEKEVKIGVVLVFPGNVRKYVPLSVAVLDDMHRDVDVILGMDIISRGNFSLNRHPEHLEFSFTFGPDFIDA